ncbi:MAG: GspE/PulE family protein [Acidobacteriota bacterium]
MPLSQFTELDEHDIDPRSVRLLDESFCRDEQVVVLGAVDRNGDEVVSLGAVEPRSRAVREAARRLGRRVEAVRLNAYEVTRALDLGWGLPDPAQTRPLLHLSPVERISFRDDTDIPFLVDQILSVAVQAGASDVHIETYPHDIDVRVRIDGVLRQFATPLSRANIDAVVARLKVLADLDIAERRRDQDGRLHARWRGGRDERGIDFRLSIVPGPYGEDVVLRILDRHRGLLDLDELGFSECDLATFEHLITNPEGMVLVTGPTGSGKTTTLYSALQRINTPENKILTVENPIEYRFAKTNQKQVSMQMDFADYARAFLRQDPDIILIGEVRDHDTADTALKAAQTGHLVLSTLHTNDSVRSVSRLQSLGVDPQLIASCLLGALAQRLLRRICPDCREETTPTAAQAERLGLAPDTVVFRGAGCDACDDRGSKGRIGIYELFVVDAESADLIAERAPSHTLRRAALQSGMRTLVDDAVDKARQGLVALDEVLRIVPYRMLGDSRR